MLGDEPVLIGGLRLFPQVTADVRATVETWQDIGKTVLLVGRPGHLLGLVAVADELRAGAKEAIHDLREAGVHSVVMLTGDNERTASVAAARLGIGSWRANLLPEQKTQVVEELLHEHGSVAMVGDGVNDAPALASASVGIAMGAAGSDTALETADVALMGDDLRRLPYLISLSRAALRTIHVNIAFSIIVKVVFLALTLLGFANLWLAILADTGAALLVIANGMRLLRFDASRRSMLNRHEQ
jgi:Cd2+/Zn2+-exporting ATPase